MSVETPEELCAALGQTSAIQRGAVAALLEIIADPGAHELAIAFAKAVLAEFIRQWAPSHDISPTIH